MRDKHRAAALALATAGWYKEFDKKRKSILYAYEPGK